MCEQIADAAGQEVECSACGRRYRCTLADDYYNNTTLEDGVCEPCLFAGKPGARNPEPRMTPELKALIDSGFVRLTPSLAAEMGVTTSGEPLQEKEPDKDGGESR